MWQWIHHGAHLDDERPVTAELYEKIRDEELKSIGERPLIRRRLFRTIATERADMAATCEWALKAA